MRGDSALDVNVSSVSCSDTRLVRRLRSAGLVVSVEPVHAPSGMHYRTDFKSLFGVSSDFVSRQRLWVSGVLQPKYR